MLWSAFGVDADELTAAKVRAARFSGAPVVVLAGCYAGRVQVSAELPLLYPAGRS